MPMNLEKWIVAGSLAGLQIACAAYLARGKTDGQSRWGVRLAVVWLTAAFVGAGSLFLRRELAQLSAAAQAQGIGSFGWALWLLTPVEEGLKAVFLGPLYSQRARSDARRGSALGASIGLALGSGHALGLGLMGVGGTLEALRALISTTGQVLSPATWGAALLNDRARRWFLPVWLLASGLRGVLDEVALRRGPGLLVLAAPLTLTLGWVCYVVVRHCRGLEGEDASDWHEPQALSGPLSALEPGRKRLRWRWVGVSLLVTVGLGLCATAIGIALGRLWGIRFNLAAEADFRSNAPLLVLGACLASAFPLCGFLLRKASRTTSLLEPALGASLAVIGAALLMRSSPVVALVALMTTPLAFGLTLTGAWFGARR